MFPISLIRINETLGKDTNRGRSCPALSVRLTKIADAKGKIRTFSAKKLENKMQLKIISLLAVPPLAAMRLISFLVALVLSSSASFAQQAPAAPPKSQTAPQGYIGAYGSPGPATPYSTGPLPEAFPSTGRSIEGPNNTTVIVKAVPCTLAARSTDGTTTCIGLPDRPLKTRY